MKSFFALCAFGSLALSGGAAFGVPLWVTGGERVRRPAPPPAVPEVSFGPGTGSMSWSF